MKKIFLILLLLYLCLGQQLTVRVFATRERWDANKLSWSPLMIYSYENNTLKIDSLLKLGININEQNQRGWTALHIAIRKGNLATVLFLLNHKANSDLSDTDGCTPLMLACGGNHFNIANLLLNFKSDPNKSLENGYTALMAATSFGNIRIMRLLIDNGANVNAKRNIDGMTALRLAEYDANKKKTNFLKRHGAK